MAAPRRRAMRYWVGIYNLPNRLLPKTTIEIREYQQTWPEEFQELAGRLRLVLGDLAVSIDHIGSTAVPGLPAKDKIDIQITVLALDPAIEQAITGLGFERADWISHDHVPPGAPEDLEQWVKWVFTAPEGLRPANIHVRIAGRMNQRYPLLFRDYLRTHPDAARAYAQVKIALARLHPNDLEAYYDVKDPVCDLILQAAELWAAESREFSKSPKSD